MTELAYMTREDWAQHGTAMQRHSDAIREWLGRPPYIFATSDLRQYATSHSADREFASYITTASVECTVIDLPDLARLRAGDRTLTPPIVALHPYKPRDCELLREVVEAGLVARLFVVIWSPLDLVRSWLDGMGAANLFSDSRHRHPDSVQLEAAKCWVNEQYNGLSGGNGKDSVVQLLRIFTASGYPLVIDTWLQAFFAVGGTFTGAGEVAKLIKEMQAGTQHRIRPRYRTDILDVLRRRVTDISRPN